MKKQLLGFFLILCILLSCSACVTTDQGDSYFRIMFLDVGQGDCALVECDGHYMLIDGGETTAGDKVYNTLEERGIQQLELLALSHLHSDHIGGLIKALSYATSIGKTISNSDYTETEVFKDFEHQLRLNGSQITVPYIGEKFELGSADVEVVDVAATENNDSLVLLITYGQTRFLFTGDIEENAQRRVAEKYQNEEDKEFKIDLIKMPHHGSKALILFIRTFMPDYAIISVGKDNSYKQPKQETLDMLDQANVKVYRTDKNGDITVTSNGKRLSSILCSK